MNYLTLLTSVKDIKDGINEAVGSGGEHDFIQIIQATSDISRLLSVIYGLLITIIYISVPFIVMLELMYICFPILRVQMENLAVKVEGSGFARRALEFTLRDAREAVERSETVDTGKNPIWIYIRLKCTSVMIIMFVLALVLTGAQGFIGFVRSLVDNIISRIFY